MLSLTSSRQARLRATFAAMLLGFCASAMSSHDRFLPLKCRACWGMAAWQAFESSRVMLFRFAVQPSIRTMAVGTGRQGLIIDYAMPKSLSE